MVWTGLLTAVVLTGCAQPVNNSGSPLDGLHACPAAGEVIGAFTVQAPTRSTTDGPEATGFNTWALTVSGRPQQLTADDVHLGAVISPDGRAVYQLRSSGRLLGDSREAPGVIERLNVATGAVTRVAELPGIVDLSISGDGRRLAVARTVESHPDTGLDVNSVTVIDLASPTGATTIPRAPDATPDLFSAVTEAALSPDGGRLAYALAIEVQRNHVVNSVRIRDLSTNSDTVVFTAQGTDFLTDLDWSPDGATVLASVRHQEPADTAETPPRFRTLRVDVGAGRATLDDGFAQDFSPIADDGSRLLGVAPAADAAGDLRGRALDSWVRGRGVEARQPIDAGAAGISVASCSYQP
jgi:hypothetical protein